MKAKLARKRRQGRGGWEDKEVCSGPFLSRLLIEHVDKGDPIDVANFAMMLHQRGEQIADSASGTSTGSCRNGALAKKRPRNRLGAGDNRCIAASCNQIKGFGARLPTTFRNADPR
jgi:hypothetical protein